MQARGCNPSPLVSPLFCRQSESSEEGVDLCQEPAFPPTAPSWLAPNKVAPHSKGVVAAHVVFFPHVHVVSDHGGRSDTQAPLPRYDKSGLVFNLVGKGYDQRFVVVPPNGGAMRKHVGTPSRSVGCRFTPSLRVSH